MSSSSTLENSLKEAENMSNYTKKKLLFLSSLVGAGTGTHTLADLQRITNQTVMQYGIENVLPAITMELEAHNRVLRDAMMAFATPTTEREEAAGGFTSFEMEEADEFNRPRGQKPSDPYKVGYPLKRFTFAMGWTAEYFNTATPAAMVARLIDVQAGHAKALQRGIRAALLQSTSYNFVPYIEDLKDTSVLVKPMYNGDGDVPAVGPQLEAFDGAHNHYLNSASLTNAAVSGLVNTVAEHSSNASIQIWINKADEDAYRGLSNFRPYLDVRERARLDQNTGIPILDTGNINNRAIGFINGAEIWVKPWMVANYSVAVNLAAADKPLKMREPMAESRRGFRPVAEIANFPLQARMFEALFGFGAYNRGAAAVLFVGAGGMYVVPSGL
jgi:hypothetical protein